MLYGAETHLFMPHGFGDDVNIEEKFMLGRANVIPNVRLHVCPKRLGRNCIFSSPMKDTSNA